MRIAGVAELRDLRLKFFFSITLDRPEAMAKMKPVHLPRKLPEILSPDEVKRLIAATGNAHPTPFVWTKEPAEIIRKALRRGR